MLPDSKKTKLVSSNQEASPSAGKITGAVLVPRLHMQVHPSTAISSGGPWVPFGMTDESHSCIIKYM